MKKFNCLHIFCENAWDWAQDGDKDDYEDEDSDDEDDVETQNEENEDIYML